jgi:hypothetical protein
VDFFDGSLDEIKIYNRTLGHYEISAMYYNSAFPSPAPTNLTAAAANGQVTLSWASCVGASGYNINRSTRSGGPYTTVASSPATVYIDSGVTNGISYYYVVSAVNAAGVGTNSNEIGATPYNLAAWFKADALIGLTNGAAVSTWTDLSGNGNDATQPVSGQQPMYVTDAMNGLPVVRFNGASSNYLAFNRPVQDDFTILCVYRSSQGIGTGTAFYQGAGLVNGEVAGVQNDFGTSLNTNGFLLAGTGNPDITIVSSRSNYNNGEPHLFTFKRTGASGTLALYADGVPAGAAAGGTQSLTSADRLVLGAQQTLIYFLTGDIAEVKIYNSALSDADRTAQEIDLERKYGIIPALTVTATGNVLALTWPDWAVNWQLWSSTNFLLPSAWSQVTNAAQNADGKQTVLLPLDTTCRFFRLSSTN